MQDEERPLTLPIPGEVYFSDDRLRPLQLSAAELSNFTGSFHSEELDATYTLSVEGGRLRVKVPNNPPIPLDAAGPNEFYSSDLGDFVFHPDADHRVSAFSLSTQASRPTRGQGDMTEFSVVNSSRCKNSFVQLHVPACELDVWSAIRKLSGFHGRD